MRKYSDREQWFIDRIGKRLFRNNYCSCGICESVYDNGIVINNISIALYCCEIESVFTMDGTPLRYFDTRDEMLEFEKSFGG